MNAQLKYILDNLSLQVLEDYLIQRKQGELGALVKELMSLIQGAKEKWDIAWVKRIREVTGFGLKESVDFLNTLLKKAGWKKGIGDSGKW